MATWYVVLVKTGLGWLQAAGAHPPLYHRELDAKRALRRWRRIHPHSEYKLGILPRKAG